MYVKFEFKGTKRKMIAYISFSGSECLINIPIIVGDACIRH